METPAASHSASHAEALPTAHTEDHAHQMCYGSRGWFINLARWKMASSCSAPRAARARVLATVFIIFGYLHAHMLLRQG
eukprot:COSAG02_NODE_11842_length_1643_cov_2.961788_1_plen_79_part_00